MDAIDEPLRKNMCDLVKAYDCSFDLKIEFCSSTAFIEQPTSEQIDARPEPEGQKLRTDRTAPTEHKADAVSGCRTSLIRQPDIAIGKPFEESVTEITVCFYRLPRITHRGFMFEYPICFEEFVCSGSTTLCELRDQVHRICNGKRFFDVSRDPEAPLPPMLETNPAFFIIDDIFYTDFRIPSSCKTSETFLEWAGSVTNLTANRLAFKPMESTRLMDIGIGLDVAMHQLHHSNCQHLIVVSKIEKVKVGKLKNYPHLRALNHMKRRICLKCKVRPFHFMVENVRGRLKEPSYLCHTCLLRFYYVNGKRIGQFKAYRVYEASNDPAEPHKQEGGDDDWRTNAGEDAKDGGAQCNVARGEDDIAGDAEGAGGADTASENTQCDLAKGGDTESNAAIMKQMLNVQITKASLKQLELQKAALN